MRFLLTALSFLILVGDVNAQFLRFSRRPIHFPRHGPFTNNPPSGFVMSAGPDQSITSSSFTLQGSSDGCSGTPSFVWVVVGGDPSKVHISDQSATNSNVNLDAFGTYTIALAGLCGSLSRLDTVKIDFFATPIVNEPPVFSGVTNIFHVADSSVYHMRFQVTDDRTASSALTVTPTAQFVSLLGSAASYVSGDTWDWSFTLPPTNQPPGSPNIGSAQLTLVATDGDGSSTTNLSGVVVYLQPQQPFASLVGGTTTENSVLSIVGSIVSDADTPLNLLTFDIQTTSPGILPQSGVAYAFNTNTGALNFTLTPAANKFGDVVLQVTVRDNQGLSTFGGLHAIWTDVNSAPGIYSINGVVLPNANVQVQATNGVLRSIPFVLFDLDGPNGMSTDASSANQLVIPNIGLLMPVGTGTNRLLNFTPTAVGSSVITLTAIDGALLTGSATFTLVVGSGNTAPTISNPGAQSTAEDAQKTVNFTVADAQTATNLLVVHAYSSDQSKVPDANLVFTGSTGTRVLTITPVLNANGVLQITNIVVDTSGLSATNVFVLTITPGNDCPVSPQIAAQATPEDVPKAVSISVSDVDGDTLTLSATSSNTGLVPNDVGHLAFTGTGNNRTLTITPLSLQNGTTTVDVTITDGTCPIHNIFVLTVAPVANPPTISTPANLTILEDGVTNVTYTVFDPDTALASLTMSAISSDPVLFPAGSMVFTGTTGTRTLTLTPAANRSGTGVMITASVSDGTSSVSSAFTINVTAQNDAPTIAPVANQTLIQGSNTLSIVVTVGDIDTAVSSLTLSATSSSLAVLPLSGIAFSGTGTNRTVTFTPATVGVSTVTITVSDGSPLTATTPSFTVTKPAPINNPPTITGPGNVTLAEDVNTNGLPVVIGDGETPAASLVLTATSSNPALVSTLTPGGSGANRTLAITLATNQNGSANISLVVSDAGGLKATNVVVLTVNGVDDAPDFTTAITSKTISIGGVQLISTPVVDIDTPIGSLTFQTATLAPSIATISSATNAAGNVTFTITGVSAGTTTASIIVTDTPGNLKDTNTFTITVTAPVNTPPTISGLVNHSIVQGGTDNQSFSVADAESGAAAVTLTVLSDNTALVPIANVVLAGSGSSRTAVITPIPSASGTVTITIVAHDPQGLTATQSFTLSVSATGGRTFFVAPNGVGSSGNSGLTQASPWNIDSVKARGTKSLVNGDLLLYLPGTYVGRYVYTGYNSSQVIIHKALNRNWGNNTALFSTFDRQEPTVGNGSIDVEIGGVNNIRFEGFEFINTALRHHFPDGNTDRGDAFYVTGRGNIQIVNNNIKDSGNGIGFEDDASIPTGSPIIAGNVTAYNGVCGTDDCQHGHGLYIQTKDPLKNAIFRDNVSHNNMGQGSQVRGGDEALIFFNLIEMFNVYFNNGFPGGSRTRNFFHGGGERATNYVFRTNYMYYAGPDGGPQAFANTFYTDSGHVGSGPNYLTNLVVQGNTIINGGLTFGRWKLAHILQNRIQSTDQQPGFVWQNQFGTLGDYLGSNLLYGVNNYTLDGSSVTKAAFTSASGGANFASSDSQVGGTMPAFVDVLVNPYDSKMANVVVWNPSGASTVTFSVGSFLAVGDTYDVFSTTNWRQRFSNGQFSGTITCNMTGFSLMAMVGFDGSPGFAGSPQSPEPFFACLRLIKTN